MIFKGGSCHPYFLKTKDKIRIGNVVCQMDNQVQIDDRRHTWTIVKKTQRHKDARTLFKALEDCLNLLSHHD
jgi:hypothetical protein